MAHFTVKLSLASRNMERLDELASRLKDFTVPLSNIIGEWARGNTRKFDAAVGAELSGADEPPTQWEPVTLAYYKQKHGPVQRGNRTMFPDWLMVRTGDLMRSLTQRGLFAEFFDATKAVFGTPLDPEEAAKASYNFAKRPTVFLGRSDRNMIRREFQDYLSLGANYKDALFAGASRRYALQKEMQILDMEFAEAVSG